MEDVAVGVSIAPGELPDDPAEARAAIQTMLARMLDKMAHERSESWSLFIVREQMKPTEAFDRIYAGPMGKMLVALVELVCVATGIKDRQASRLTVLTLFGQVLVIRASRATCSRLLDRSVDDRALIAELKARIAANTDAILDSLSADRQDI